MKLVPEIQPSLIHFVPPSATSGIGSSRIPRRESEFRERARDLLANHAEDAERLRKLLDFSRKVRISEYHLTNACNIRCEGCWFFSHGHDKETKETTDLGELRRFLEREKQRRINAALLIGGEPTLFLGRLAAFRQYMPYMTVSTNGLKKIPRKGFEDVAIGITLFGGGPLDDELRAIKPNGERFSGLFEIALKNYAGDSRAGFIYAITEAGLDYMEDTVLKIRDAGSRLNFNYYRHPHHPAPSAAATAELLHEALRLREAYPDTIASHPYYIRTLLTGRSHWGEFGHATCPSISTGHPANDQRLRNGQPFLPFFNAWSADLRTLKFCCTSGHCNDCRDSQAIYSWLLVNKEQFLGSTSMLQTWIEIAESYWSQFPWSPYHPTSKADVNEDTRRACIKS